MPQEKNGPENKVCILDSSILITPSLYRNSASPMSTFDQDLYLNVSGSVSMDGAPYSSTICTVTTSQRPQSQEGRPSHVRRSKRSHLLVVSLTGR